MNEILIVTILVVTVIVACGVGYIMGLNTRQKDEYEIFLNCLNRKTDNE